MSDIRRSASFVGPLSIRKSGFMIRNPINSMESGTEIFHFKLTNERITHQSHLNILKKYDDSTSYDDIPRIPGYKVGIRCFTSLVFPKNVKQFNHRYIIKYPLGHPYVKCFVAVLETVVGSAKCAQFGAQYLWETVNDFFMLTEDFSEKNIANGLIEAIDKIDRAYARFIQQRREISNSGCSLAIMLIGSEKIHLCSLGMQYI